MSDADPRPSKAETARAIYERRHPDADLDPAVVEAAARAMADADHFSRGPSVYVTLARVALAAARTCAD